jgi:hypothetical protein
LEKESVASRRGGKSLDVAKRERVQAKRYAERGLRRRVVRTRDKRDVVTQQVKFSGDRPVQALTRQEISQRKKHWAASRRAKLQIGNKRRSSRTKASVSSSSPVVVRPLYQQFKRTGKLPVCSIQAIRDGDRTGVTSDQLKQLINAMLVRAGIEENPGPPSEVTSSTPPDYEPDVVIDVGTKAKQGKWVPKAKVAKLRCINCGLLGHGWRNCPQPRNEKKRGKERAKFVPTKQKMVEKAVVLEAQKAAGEKMADRELAREKQESAPKKPLVRDTGVPQLQNFTVRYGDCQFRSPWRVAYAATLNGDFAPLNQAVDTTSVFGCITTNMLKVISLVGTATLAAMTAKVAGKASSTLVGRLIGKFLSFVGVGGAAVVAKKVFDHFHTARGRVRSYRFECPLPCPAEDLVGGMGPNPQCSDAVDPHFRAVKITDTVMTEESYFGLSIPRITTYQKIVTISETLFALLLQKSVRLRNKTRAEVIESLSLFADGYKDVPIPLRMETGRRSIAAETVDVVADWLTSSPAWSLGGQESALTY